MPDKKKAPIPKMTERRGSNNEGSKTPKITEPARAVTAARSGAAFNLQTFHDNFMRQGPAPIKIIRKSMLHDDSPVL